MHYCRHSLLKVTLRFRYKTWLCHAKNSKLLKERSFRSLKTNTLTEYNIQENAWQKFTLKLSLILTDFSFIYLQGTKLAQKNSTYLLNNNFFFANIKQ